MKALTIRPGKLTLAQLRDVYQHPVTLTLDDNAYGPIQQSVACVERIVEENRTAYGINTGFGLLASTRIATRRSGKPAAFDRAVARRRRRRAAGRRHGAPDHGAQDQQPGARLLRHPPGR